MSMLFPEQHKNLYPKTKRFSQTGLATGMLQCARGSAKLAAAMKLTDEQGETDQRDGVVPLGQERL